MNAPNAYSFPYKQRPLHVVPTQMDLEFDVLLPVYIKQLSDKANYRFEKEEGCEFNQRLNYLGGKKSIAEHFRFLGNEISSDYTIEIHEKDRVVKLKCLGKNTSDK